MSNELHVLARVSSLLREMMAIRGTRYCDLPVPKATLSYGLNGRNIRIATLVRIADALGCDVVIHLRERPRQKGTPRVTT